MTRADQIAAIKPDQQFWRDLAAEVGPDRYAEPGPMGEWSFGDMAGHLLGWRKRTINRLEAFANDQPEPPNPWPADLDANDGSDDPVNAWIHAQHTGRAGGGVRRQLRPPGLDPRVDARRQPDRPERDPLDGRPARRCAPLWPPPRRARPERARMARSGLRSTPHRP
jgi:hypothetical protein